MDHQTITCKANIQPAAVDAKNAQEKEGNQPFVATCFSID